MRHRKKITIVGKYYQFYIPMLSVWHTWDTTQPWWPGLVLHPSLLQTLLCPTIHLQRLVGRKDHMKLAKKCVEEVHVLAFSWSLMMLPKCFFSTACNMYYCHPPVIISCYVFPVFSHFSELSLGCFSFCFRLWTNIYWMISIFNY